MAESKVVSLLLHTKLELSSEALDGVSEGITGFDTNDTNLCQHSTLRLLRTISERVIVFLINFLI